jgi:hypothetical protein
MSSKWRHLLDINRTYWILIPVNQTKDKSVAHEVRRRILNSADKALWAFDDFSDLNPRAVAAALSRLGRLGEVRRVRRGLYYRPRKTAFGESRPDPNVVADAVLRKNASVPSGEYNRLGLTSQVSGSLTRTVGGRGRKKNVLGIHVRTLSRPLDAQKGITGEERTLLDALRGTQRLPDTSSEAAILRIKDILSSKRFDFSRLASFAAVEPPRVRALLGAIGQEIGIKTKLLNQLHAKINPLSKYKIPGAAGALVHAAEWQIV